MCIHITSLVVQERQAGEDLQIICFFGAIAAEDEFIIPLPFGDLMPCHSSGSSRGPGSGRLHGACIDSLHEPFLNFWSGHYLYLSILGALTVKPRGGGGGG